MRVSRTVAKPMLHSSCSPPSSPGSPRGFMSSLCTVQRRPRIACFTDTALKTSTSRVAAPKRCRLSFPLFPCGSTVVTARMESRVLVKGAIVRHHFATRGDPSAARSIAPRYTEALSVAGRGAPLVCGHLNDTNHTALAVWRPRSEIRAVDWLGADGCNRLRGCAPSVQSSQGVVAARCRRVSCQPRWSTRHTVNAG